MKQGSWLFLGLMFGLMAAGFSSKSSDVKADPAISVSDSSTPNAPVAMMNNSESGNLGAASSGNGR